MQGTFGYAESQFLRMYQQTSLIQNSGFTGKKVRVTKVEIVCGEYVRRAFWDHVTKKFKQWTSVWQRHLFGCEAGLSMIQCMKTSSNQLILAHINSDEAQAPRQQDDGGAVVVSNEKHVYSKFIVHFEHG